MTVSGENAILGDMLKSARRELALRKRAYPKWVETGRMKKGDMDHEIAMQEKIVLLLERVRQVGGYELVKVLIPGATE